MYYKKINLQKEAEGERGKEKKRDIKTPGLPAYPPIPSTQLPIQTGVSAPAAAGGGGFGSLCGPLLV